MNILYGLFPLAVAYMVPLLLGAIGVICSKRAGIINYGVEGFMVLGAASCSVAMYLAGGDASFFHLMYIGLITSVIFSLLAGFIYHLFAVKSKDALSLGVVFTLLAYLLSAAFVPILTGYSTIMLPFKERYVALIDVLPPLTSSILYSTLLAYFLFSAVRIIFQHIPFLSAPYTWFTKVFNTKIVRVFSFVALGISLLLSLIVNNIAFILIFLIFSLIAIGYISYRWEKGQQDGRAEERRIIASLGGPLTLTGFVFIIAIGGYGDAIRMILLDHIQLSAIVALIFICFVVLMSQKGRMAENKRLSMMLSAVLSGLGGGIYMITVAGAFNSFEGVKGVGLVALACAAFGSFRFRGALWSSLLLAFCYAVVSEASSLPLFEGINPAYILGLLYAVILLAGVLSTRRVKKEY